MSRQDKERLGAAGRRAVEWALSVLDQSHPPPIDLIAGSAGARRYARIGTPPASHVVVWGGDPDEMQRFCSWQKIFRDNDVRVPCVRAQERAQGWLLLSDGGTPELLSLQSSMHPENGLMLDDAMYQLSRLHSVAIGSVTVFRPSLGDALGVFERLVLEPDELSDRRSFGLLASWLVDTLNGSPSGVVHGDYHARNVLFLDARATVVDFQDAHIGPFQVDVAAFAADHNLRRSRDEIVPIANRYARHSPTDRTELARCLPAAVIFWHCRLLGRLAEIRDTYGAARREAHNAIHYLTLMSTWSDLSPRVREATAATATAASRYWESSM